MKYPAWQIKTAEPGAEEKLAAAGCGVLLRRVLAARGVCNEGRPVSCWNRRQTFRTVPAAGHGQGGGAH